MRKISRLLKFYQRFRDEDAILVYQMGKVGSTSIENSLPNALHVHTLFGNSPCFVDLDQRRNTYFKKLQGRIADWVKRFALKRRNKVKIITVMRDPLSRNISMFFQNLPHWMCEYIGKHDIDIREEGFDVLVGAFNDVYDHFYFNSWFDREIKRLTGVDIFEHEFDPKTGHLTIKDGGWEILVLTLEDLEKNKVVLDNFCGHQIDLRSSNISVKKWYAPVLNGFKYERPLSSEYVEKIYDTKTARFFYDDDRIEQFKRKSEGYVGR